MGEFSTNNQDFGSTGIQRFIRNAELTKGEHNQLDRILYLNKNTEFDRTPMIDETIFNIIHRLPDIHI